MDKYTSLACLKKHLGKESYRVRCLNRRSPVTIISPHGGFIEPGSSAIARSIAACGYNLFDFQGLRPELANDMHVTATRFRDPDLSRMLKRSAVAISIHGMGDQGHDHIWLGGLNAKLKELVLSQLQSANFTVNPNSPRYRGESPQNVVNLACQQGVQLELPNELVVRLFSGSPFVRNGRSPRTNDLFKSLVDGVRAAIRLYEPVPPLSPCPCPE